MPIVPNPDDNARDDYPPPPSPPSRDETPLETATNLLTQAAESIGEFLEVDECRCDQMVDADGEDLGPCAKCTAEDLLTRINMFLESDTCTACHGSGLDPVHKWPDGSAAHCEHCDGYGTASPLGPFKVLTRRLGGWDDCWTFEAEEGKETPERFRTRKDAEEAIAEHIADCQASRLSDEYQRSDFRIVPADQPPHPEP